MASNTTFEVPKIEETPTNNDSLVELTEARNEDSLPSRKRKLRLHSLTPSEAQEGLKSGSLLSTPRSALARYAGSFKLRFLGDGTTRKGRKARKGASSNTIAEDIDNYQKQTESSSLKIPELDTLTESVTFAETESSAAEPPVEKTTDEANVVIPGTLKPDITANNSTEANNIVRDPDDQAVVNEVALGAGEDEGEDRREDDAMVALGTGGDGGDGGERGGDGDSGGGGGGGYDDSDSKIPSLTPELPEEKEEEFHFFLPEEEPVLHRDFQQRAKKAVQAAVLGAVDEQKQSASGQCFQCCNACCKYDPIKSPKPSKFTPQLKVASTQGLKMMKKLFSPVLPRVLRDLWVYAEIAVTLYQFILGLISLSLENNQAFNITYLVLATINVALALLDGFVYFIQLGSCVQCFRYCYSKYRRRKVTLAEKEEEEDEDEKEEGSKRRSWWKLSPKRQQQVGEWIELVRSIATELLLYPLLICDLFEFIVGRSFRRESNADQINFSLFIVGGFYLLVSVYFMRMFMVIGSIFNLVRIPLNASKSRKSYLRLIIWFSVHVLAQAFASAVIIVTVAVKINDENSEILCPSINSTMSICASPFLIYSAVVGGIIPLFGVASFFVVNFYQMRQLSAGLWIDMISLLQSESFADLVFQGGGVKVAKTKAKNFVQQIELNDVKKQYKAWRNSPVWGSIVYPFKVPIIAALGILYELLLASFLTTIFLGPLGRDTDLSPGVLVWYSVVVGVLVIVNLPVILFATLWLLMALAMLLLAILLPVYVLLQALLLYIPVGASFGCLVYCSSSSSELGVFQRLVKSLTRLREIISGHGRKRKQEEKNTDNEGTPVHHNAVVASESVPMPINSEPPNSSQLQQAPTGDLITIEFVDTQNA